MKYIKTSDKTNIYYEVKGEGRPIIFIHGFSENNTCFRIQQRALSKQYKIITYDLRGHGKSDKSDKGLNFERFAMDLRELIESLEIEDVVLVGWSMGASIIFEYIKIFGRDRISKVCFVDMTPKLINDNTWELGLYHGRYTMLGAEEDLKSIKDNWMEFGMGFMKIMAPYFTEDQKQVVKERLAPNSPNVMYSMWKALIQMDYRNILDKINIPTLILFGEKSTLYSTEVGEYLRDNIKDSQLEIFEDCTHLLVLENPIRFNKLLSEFIEEKPI